jgi:hypothetical protein
VLVFIGANGTEMAAWRDYSGCLPSEIRARNQEAHIKIGYIFCEFVEQKLFGDRLSQ